MAVLRVLTIVEQYLPGTKSGGPVRSIGDLVESLGDEVQFDILTRDRDLGDAVPYAEIRTRAWYCVGKARVRYLSPSERTIRGWREVLGSVEADVVYLNGVFPRSSMKILLLRRLGLIPARPVVLAPRCEFHHGAISLKPLRKKIWLRLCRWLGLFGGVIWHAATEDEAADIRGVVGTNRSGRPIVRVAGQVTHRTVPASGEGQTAGRACKRPGHARVVFVSRISRKKNLDYALRVLAASRGRVQFDVYGPLEDRTYWSECRSIIERLPPTIVVRYMGHLEPSDVCPTFAQYHLFLFPTRGESFGHVVFESLLAGCPVLLSDQTPWHRLESAGAGWAVPLGRPAAFTDRLNALFDMDEPAFRIVSGAARALGAEVAADRTSVDANRRLFRESAARSSSWSA